jgi:hypothetical protein
MASRVEAFLYSEGSKTTMEATTTLTAGGTDAILSTTKVFADALTEWTSDLGGAYAVTWDSTANAVKVANSTSFTLTFTGNLHNALGFSASSGYTGQTSYTGDQQALGRYDVLKIECSTLEDGAQPDLRQYRHLRAEVLAFGTVDLYRCRIYMTQAQATSYLSSYCAAGKIRLYQDSDETSAWSATNVDGYLDGWIVALSDLETHGHAEEVVSVSLVLAVPR